MDSIPYTASKPVVGKEAAKLIKALKEDGHVANATALETITRITARCVATAPNLAAR